MTTKITITNDNQGEPWADWDVEVVIDGKVEQTLRPGESSTNLYLWHDGRSLQVREKVKADAVYVPNGIPNEVDPLDAVEYGCPPHQPDHS